MARAFARASAQVARYNAGSGPVTALPFTMAAWVYPVASVTNGQIQYFFTIGDAANDSAQLHIEGISGAWQAKAVIYADATGPAKQAVTAVAATANAWNHYAGVFTATDRSIYLNGANKVTNSGALSGGTWNDSGIIVVGGANFDIAENPFDGRIGEAGIWNVALDDDEVAALGKGFSPLLIRPGSLVAYWPLFGNDSPELDRSKNRYDLTLVNTPTKADHPRIYYPTSAHSGMTTVVVAAPAIPLVLDLRHDRPVSHPIAYY